MLPLVVEMQYKNLARYMDKWTLLISFLEFKALSEDEPGCRWTGQQEVFANRKEKI
jgi:hypothetical protein